MKKSINGCGPPLRGETNRLGRCGLTEISVTIGVPKRSLKSRRSACEASSSCAVSEFTIARVEVKHVGLLVVGHEQVYTTEKEGLR